MSRSVAFLGLVLTVFGCASAPPRPAAPAPRVRFLFPREGAVIGGSNVLLWASAVGVHPASVVFEASSDGGRTYVDLPHLPAPFFGPDSATSSFDARSFRGRALRLRARADRLTAEVNVRLDRLPEPSCSVRGERSRVVFDCSASRDEDDAIVLYGFFFGDGTPAVTSKEPVVTHAYEKLGLYDVSFAVRDASGMEAPLWKILRIGDDAADVTLQDRDGCGCERMILRRTGASSFDGQPLGPRTGVPHVAFEIHTVLEPGSNHNLCTEGQKVRVVTYVDGANQRIKTCRSGYAGPCQTHADCDTRVCSGGGLNGWPCDSAEMRGWCVNAGGTCVGRRDGRCEECPLGGSDSPWCLDDYNKPWPIGAGVKWHSATAKGPIWFDAPGWHYPYSNRLRMEAQFLAIMHGTAGRRSCQCRFNVVIDWDGNKQTDRSRVWRYGPENQFENWNCKEE